MATNETYGAIQATDPDVLFRLKEMDDGESGKIPQHYEADAQRSQLLNALGNLGTQVTLASILAALQAQSTLAATLWTDNSGAFYVRRDTIDEDSGTVVVSFTNPTGTIVTPGAGLRPAANEESLQTEVVRYAASVGGTGYSAGDLLERVVIMDVNASPPVVVASTWVNLITGAIIVAPTIGNLIANPTALAANAATETTLAQILAQAATEGTLAQLLGVVTNDEDPVEVVGVSGSVPAVPATTASAYVAGECIGGKLNFADIARENGLTGIVQSVMIQSKIALTMPMDLILFNADPTATTFTDSAAFTLATADFDKVEMRIPILTTDWSSLGGPCVAQPSAVSQEFKAGAAVKNLWGVLIARGSATLTSTTDLRVVLKVMQD